MQPCARSHGDSNDGGLPAAASCLLLHDQQLSLSESMTVEPRHMCAHSCLSAVDEVKSTGGARQGQPQLRGGEEGARAAARMERLGRVGVHVHGTSAPSLTPCDLLITGGRVIDPANQIDHENWDVAVADGVILAVGPGLREQYAARTTHDARGQLVTPGLVDAHGHFYRHCTPLGGPPL